MKGSTVNSKGRCTSLFCDNCGVPTQMGVTQERRQQMERDKVAVHCNDCYPYHIARLNAQAGVDHATGKLEDLKTRRAAVLEKLAYEN